MIIKWKALALAVRVAWKTGSKRELASVTKIAQRKLSQEDWLKLQVYLAQTHGRRLRPLL